MREVLIIIFSALIISSFGQNISSESSGSRIKKITDYQSSSFDIPNIINESTASKLMETDFLYQDEVIVGIKRTIYLENEIATEYDSVTYLTKDSVSIFRKNERGIRNFNLKLIDFQELKNRISSADFFSFYSGYNNLIVKKSRQNELTLIRVYQDSQDTLNLSYHYDSFGKINKIKELNLRNNVQSLSTLNYNDGYIFTITSSHGMLFSTFNKYQFSEDGLLQQEGEESDTNAYLRKFEYETGNGNSGSFVNNIYDVLYCRPLIK